MSNINIDKIKEFATILVEIAFASNPSEYKNIMSSIDNMSAKEAEECIRITKNNIEKYKKLYDLAQEITK